MQFGKFQKPSSSSYPMARYQSGGLLGKITTPNSNDKIVIFRKADSATASVDVESTGSAESAESAESVMDPAVDFVAVIDTASVPVIVTD